MKQVAVIILNWNGEKLLKEFLPQVISNTDSETADIIVADNGSTDGSVDLLETEFPQVQVMRFETNLGFAAGYNEAINRANYPYVVLLNSDAAPANNWIGPMHDFMVANPDIGACQPKILSYTHKNDFEYAGASGGFIDRHGYPYCRGRIFGTCETDEGQYDNTANVFWASGAALMVQRDIYLKAGGLDPAFFAHMEEIDLCWRIQLLGYKIAVVPQSIVYHLGGGSLPAENPKKTYLNFRNNLLMLHKNLPDASRARKLFVRRLLDTIAWGKFVVTFDWKNANAVWRAHRDFSSMRKNYNKHPQIDLLSKKFPNIIFDYYLKGKTKYSQLKKMVCQN